MKNSILKVLIKAGLTLSLASTLSGCVGSNAVTEKLMQFNVKAVDNRYARGGLNMLLAPAYAATATVDYLVINSLEFWTGTNPINGKAHIFDSDVDTMLKINDELDPSFTKPPVELPIEPLTQVESAQKQVYSAQMKTPNANTVDFHLVYSNGETAILRGEKSGDLVNFYMDGELVTTTSMDELAAYQASKA